MKKNGEDTPLDHIPEGEYSFKWFMGAYMVLNHSCNENGTIPLSELKIYEETFGLIGSFREFCSIIYAINDLYADRRERKRKQKK